jgi:hypothetical protein
MEKFSTQIRVQTAERTEETTGNQRAEVGAYGVTQWHGPLLEGDRGAPRDGSGGGCSVASCRQRLREGEISLSHLCSIKGSG